MAAALNQEKIIKYRENLSVEIDQIHTLASFTIEEHQCVFECNKLLLDEMIKVNDPKQNKRILYFYIDNLNLSKLDTEMKEYFLSSIEKIADIAEINISFKLNRKLYGWVLALLVSMFSK